MTDQTHPVPKKVSIGSTAYTLVAFYFPDNPTATDNTYHAGCFGNFYGCPVTVDHPDPATRQKIVPTPKFQTSEAAFHALKWWSHGSIRDHFETLVKGRQAFDYSQNTGTSADTTYAGLGPQHSDAARLNAMELVLTQKYTQNADLKAALLSTDDAYLLEHAEGSHDTFWSDGGYKNGADIPGTNHLGRTLMKIRAALGGKPAPAGTDNDTIVADFKKLV